MTQELQPNKFNKGQKRRTTAFCSMDEDYLNQERKRAEDQIKEIRKGIQYEFQKETCNEANVIVQEDQIALPQFLRELNLIQSQNQRLRSKLKYHKEYLLNVTADSDGGEVSVETQEANSGGQLFYTFSKRSYASTTFGFFPNQASKEELKEKLAALGQKRKIIKQYLEAEAKNHECLMSSLMTNKKTFHSLQNQVAQEERQLNQFIQQQEDTYQIQFQADEKKKDSIKVLLDVKQRMDELESVGQKYTTKKYMILDELRKDNEFHEGSISKVRQQMLQYQKINQQLEEQLNEINNKEQQRIQGINQQYHVTQLTEAFNKLNIYFLEGQIYSNPSNIEEIKQLQEINNSPRVNQTPQKTQTRQVFEQQKLEINKSKVIPKGNKNKQLTFLTSVEIVPYNSGIKDKEEEVVIQPKFSMDDSNNFKILIEEFHNSHPEGINVLADSLIREFRDLHSEAGVLEHLYVFLTKQVEENTIKLEELEQESSGFREGNSFLEEKETQTKLDEIKMDMLNNQNIALDSGLVQLPTTGLATINLLKYSRLDRDDRTKTLIDRRNENQRFSFLIYLNLMEFMNKMCSILSKVQETSSLIPIEFEKQYQTMILRLKSMKNKTQKFRFPSQEESNTNVNISSAQISQKSLSATPADTPRQMEVNQQQMIIRLGEQINQGIFSLGLPFKMTQESQSLISEILDQLKSDYVCKIFIDKEKINKYLTLILLRFKDDVEWKSDLILDTVRFQLEGMNREIHSDYQQNLRILLNIGVILIKQLRSQKGKLAHQMLGKDINYEDDKAISAPVQSYMNKAITKLLNNYQEFQINQEVANRMEHSNENSNSLHLKNKISISTTSNFKNDIQSLSKINRKVAQPNIEQIKQYSLNINKSILKGKYELNSEITDNEQDNLESERQQMKKQQIEQKYKEENRTNDLCRETGAKQINLFNRLNSDYSHKRLLQNERSHQRELFETKEILFKIKQMDKKIKKNSQDGFLKELIQDKMQKEKNFQNEFKGNNKSLENGKPKFNLGLIDETDDILERHINFSSGGINFESNAEIELKRRRSSASQGLQLRMLNDPSHPLTVKAQKNRGSIVFTSSQTFAAIPEHHNRQYQQQKTLNDVILENQKNKKIITKATSIILKLASNSSKNEDLETLQDVPKMEEHSTQKIFRQKATEVQKFINYSIIEYNQDTIPKVNVSNKLHQNKYSVENMSKSPYVSSFLSSKSQTAVLNQFFNKHQVKGIKQQEAKQAKD